MIHDVSEEYDQLQSNIGSILRTLAGSFNELALEYTDTEGATVTLLPGIDAVELLSHYSGRKFMCLEFGHLIPEDQYVASEFLSRYKALWKRRQPQLGWLDQMLKRTDYDPFENYDRREEGGWSDTTDIGARSGTDNLTDTMAARSDSETITPTVKTKETVTPTVKTRETVTPTLKTKETVTPTVKTQETETPGVTETKTETPRAARTTTEQRGISETVAESFYGDNSSVAVPSRSTVTTPGNGQNVTTVAGASGTDTTEVTRTGNNTKTTEVLSGDTQTVNEIVSGDTQTVNEVVSGNTETVNEVVSGNTATSRSYGGHTDTHNRSTASLAAQDVLTRLFDEYRVHGNIGVSTVSDQIRKELELRGSIDLAELFIRDFVEKFTFFAE